MFTTIIVQPIFNLLVLIYALIPGHNFGLAIIIFTIIIRMLLWPLVKKQLHHAKAIRQLQPELKKIKAAAKGDRRRESQLTMELYKERQVNPLASLGIVLVQVPILIGLYLGIKRIIDKPEELVSFTYPFILDLSWMQTLAKDISQFDNTLFGLVDLSRTAVGQAGIYLPALLIAAAASITQFFQSRQLMPKSEDSRNLRSILRDAGKGQQADQQEVSAAVGRSMLYLIPGFVFLVSISLAAALPLYWLTSSLIALWQQSRILKEDVVEAEAVTDKPMTKEEAVASLVNSGQQGKRQKSKSNKKKAKAKRKRRRR